MTTSSLLCLRVGRLSTLCTAGPSGPSAAAAEGKCVVTGLWDIAKFFERIVHAL